MKEVEKEATMLYAALLVVLGLFFAALFFFVISARQLNSEGVYRPPRPTPSRIVRPRPVPVTSPTQAP